MAEGWVMDMSGEVACVDRNVGCFHLLQTSGSMIHRWIEGIGPVSCMGAVYEGRFAIVVKVDGRSGGFNGITTTRILVDE